MAAGVSPWRLNTSSSWGVRLEEEEEEELRAGEEECLVGIAVVGC